MNTAPCSACGDLDGCHLRSRLARFRDAVAKYRDECHGYGRILPKVVCLCGSTRFMTEFYDANMRETLAGRIVLTVGMSSKGDCQPTEEQKAELDALHCHKIDLADEILVLNVGGYIGDSTRREIDHARRTGKLVRYLEPGVVHNPLRQHGGALTTASNSEGI